MPWKTQPKFYTVLLVLTWQCLRRRSWDWLQSWQDVWTYWSKSCLERWEYQLLRLIKILITLFFGFFLHCWVKLSHIYVFVCTYFKIHAFFSSCRTSVSWRLTSSRSLARPSLRLWPRNIWMTQTSSSSGFRSNWCPSFLPCPRVSCLASAPRTSPAQFTKLCEFIDLWFYFCHNYAHCMVR